MQRGKAEREKAECEQKELESYNLLRSVQDALYAEVDKINKKAPREKVSDYALRKVNEHIENVKAFLPNDRYVAGITQFIPAGDNPEYRDVALVLAELDASLQRYRKAHSVGWSQF